jgi:hypothetical protein
MNPVELTARHAPATIRFMREKRSARGWAKGSLPLVVAGSLALGGCISVEAPDKPIVIELNINIRQEVIYRLAEDAGETIEENADIF